MPKITLIRHGQAQFGAQHYDQLSPLGYEQSTQLGMALASRAEVPTHVMMGSLLRHQQTAEYCLRAANLPYAPLTHAGFNEFNHTQVLERANPLYCDRQAYAQWLNQHEKPQKIFAAFFREAMHRWITGAHDEEYDEPWHAFQARVNAALEETLSSLSGDDHLWVFTSGGCISVIAQRLLGLSNEATLNVNWVMANASLTRLMGNAQRLHLLTLNECSHFSGKHQSLLSYR